MANRTAQRILREIKEVIKREEVANCAIKVELIKESYTELKAEITGPPGTAYEGGTFVLDIKVPKTYPFKPPLVKFITKIWHPNISFVTGDICLDILKGEWTASMTLKTVLLSLQALLSDPKHNYPLDAVVAKQFKDNPEMFKMTARHWTNVYAGGPHGNKDCDDKIKCLGQKVIVYKRMLVCGGVNEHQARLSLSNCNWDIKRAAKQIFSRN